jgi:phage terminase large subunit-like protein
MTPTYHFYINENLYEVTYEEYLASKYLMTRVNDKKLYRLFCGRSIYLMEDEFLKRDEEMAKLLGHLEMLMKGNAIRYFSPHGKEAYEFINDATNDVKLIVCPNRVGKTTLAIVDMVLDAIPTDPNWAIFREHGVKYRQWDGPKRIGIGTYKWSMHKQVLWPELKKWIPRIEIAEYKKDDPRCIVKDISWERKASIRLRCGSMFFFYVYEQDQDVFESQALDRWMWDEQPPEARFDGADERLRTRSGRHVFSLTPHKVEGRPDTGAHSWIHRMDAGKLTKGHYVKTYRWSIADVPDWIYPEKEKEKAYDKWITEPHKTNNLKAIREGKSRFLGEWHETAGLVIDEWDRRVHVIDDFEIPADWTRYRGLDHGTNNPTACLCAAVNPEQDVFFYAEYYQKGRTIAENVPAIIEMCGNKRIKLDTWNDPRTGIGFQIYEEEQVSQRFFKSVLDGRSFSQKEMGREIGWLYKAYGLHVQPASGARSDEYVPAIKDLFRVDQERTHYVTGNKGAPKAYVLRSLVNFIREIEGWVWDTYESKSDEKNVKETPKKLNDHLMSCFIKGTKITTLHGHKNIEDIKIGDIVKSSNGFSVVKASMMTDKNAELWEATFSNGAKLVGTGDHPVYSVSQNKYIHLDSLTYMDVVCSEESQDHVRVVAVQNLGIRGSVYNLSVSDPHNYYANGILVHNCTAYLAQVPLRYFGNLYLTNSSRRVTGNNKKYKPRSKITGY